MTLKVFPLGSNIYKLRYNIGKYCKHIMIIVFGNRKWRLYYKCVVALDL